MAVAKGDLLVGKYRVERVLGQGGMGVVVAARHIALDEDVAIKFLLPEALRSVEAVARFEREARAAVRIKSEHVARVTDVGRLETGAPYMVMELLRGRDLGAVLEQRGPLPLADVVDYILQAGEAIAEAHVLGIVHRDLKPPNLFLTERADGSPCVKVLDFGISKLAGPNANDEQGLTSTTAVMGSPLYMSPEQLMSARDVDMRTDVWALGVICYELLTGTPPFAAETLPQLCMAITSAPATPIRNHRPELPVELESLLMRCLEKDRRQRCPSVAALAAELVNFAPRRARLSAERIERLARAAGFSASALVPPPSSDGDARDATRLGSSTIAEFGRTKSTAFANKLRLGVVAGVLAAVAAGAFARTSAVSLAVSVQPSRAATTAPPVLRALPVTTNLPPLATPSDGTTMPHLVLPAETPKALPAVIVSPSPAVGLRSRAAKPAGAKVSGVKAEAIKVPEPRNPAVPSPPAMATAPAQAAVPSPRSRL